MIEQAFVKKSIEERACDAPGKHGGLEDKGLGSLSRKNKDTPCIPAPFLSIIAITRIIMCFGSQGPQVSPLSSCRSRADLAWFNLPPSEFSFLISEVQHAVSHRTKCGPLFS